MMDDFAKRLNAFLREKDIDPRTFASRIGVDHTNVYKWMNGQGKPRYSCLRSIGEVYGVDINWLMGLTKEVPDNFGKALKELERGTISLRDFAKKVERMDK